MSVSQYSPFLQRKIPAERQYRDESRETYAEKIIPDADAQLALIEKLRYRMYERAGTLGRPMKMMREWGLRNAWWLGALIYGGWAVHGRFL